MGDETLDETRKQLLLAMGYSEKAVAILKSESNMGIMENPSVQAKHQGSCGDIMILSLKIEQGIIKDAQYEYVGCAGLQSCASALTEMIKGMSTKNAVKIDQDKIIQYLEGIPEQKYECAEIAQDTLRKAIADFS